MALNPKSRAGASSRDLRGRIHISHNSLFFLSSSVVQDGEYVCHPWYRRRVRALSAAILLGARLHGGSSTARREESPKGPDTEALGLPSGWAGWREWLWEASPQCGVWSRRS